MTDWLEIGKIVAAQGLDGELRVYPNSDFPERFLEPGQRWLLRPGETEPQPVELLGGWCIPGKGLYVVELAGVEDRNQAEALAGAYLMVPETDRPILGEDEYHVLDLIGLEVFNQLTQEVLGTVVDVIPAGNDLLEVQLPQAPVPPSTELYDPKVGEQDNPNPDSNPAIVEGSESAVASNPRTGTKAAKKRKAQPKSPKPTTVLIPFVKAIAPVVDLEAGRIEITPPPGLLEINQN